MIFLFVAYYCSFTPRKSCCCLGASVKTKCGVLWLALTNTQAQQPRSGRDEKYRPSFRSPFYAHFFFDRILLFILLDLAWYLYFFSPLYLCIFLALLSYLFLSKRAVAVAAAASAVVACCWFGQHFFGECLSPSLMRRYRLNTHTQTQLTTTR